MLYICYYLPVPIKFAIYCRILSWSIYTLWINCTVFICINSLGANIYFAGHLSCSRSAVWFVRCQKLVEKWQQKIAENQILIFCLNNSEVTMLFLAYNYHYPSMSQSWKYYFLYIPCINKYKYMAVLTLRLTKRSKMAKLI